MGGERQVPAVGIAFGLVPIMEVIKSESNFEKEPKVKTLAKVCVIPINTVEESLKIVQQLRTEGIKADFAIGKKGVSKNLEYANSLGLPFVMIVGENELKKKKVMLRDMQSGQEQLLTLKEAIKKLR